MIILFSFVLQAVSYEFQSRAGNLLGKTTYRFFLALNGVIGPVLLGAAVATFFTGSAFYIDKGNMADLGMPVISRWANGFHGLDALGNVWNIVLGLAVFFLARVLGILYFVNNINDRRSARLFVGKCRPVSGLLPAVPYIYNGGRRVCRASRYGEIYMEPYKYLHNFLVMPVVLVLFLLGVVGVLWGIVRTLWKPAFRKGIWCAGAGTVLTVLALFLVAGYNHTAYYPSVADLQSSLTLENSCSSPFTLKVMAYVSILVPFVLAYIFYTWRSIDRRKITVEEMKAEGEHRY